MEQVSILLQIIASTAIALAASVVLWWHLPGSQQQALIKGKE